MTQQYVPELGKLAPDNAFRDAVHVAVAPIVAGEDLIPGAHVGLINNQAYGAHPEPIGVVDPFLERGPNRGEKFWLFLYPNTVTSLRHAWTHPAFKVVVPTLKETSHGA